MFQLFHILLSTLYIKLVHNYHKKLEVMISIIIFWHFIIKLSLDLKINLNKIISRNYYYEYNSL